MSEYATWVKVCATWTLLMVVLVMTVWIIYAPGVAEGAIWGARFFLWSTIPVWLIALIHRWIWRGK